jgi:hypothetical protein
MGPKRPKLVAGIATPANGEDAQRAVIAGHPSAGRYSPSCGETTVRVARQHLRK